MFDISNKQYFTVKTLPFPDKTAEVKDNFLAVRDFLFAYSIHTYICGGRLCCREFEGHTIP